MNKKIGIVLSKTPGYSETFFISKIKGLQGSGALVTLFAQKKDANFNLCEVKVAPRIHKNPILFLIQILSIGFGLLPHTPRIFKLFKLEKESGKTTSQILKTIFLNAHLLKANLDWLHFGFATLALGSENIAGAIESKLAISVRGFDICIYPVKHPNCYNLLWKRLDKVHAISEDLIGKLKYEGLPDNVPIEKITPAIDTTVFKKDSSENKFDFPDLMRIISVARLHWKKGFLYTLEALARIKKEGVNFKYVIVGDGEAYEEIIFAIHQLDLVDNVQLVGKKSRSEIIELYSQSDIFIQYSITEGFCNAVLEAQSIGLLTVVSDAEGLAENVAHNESGWVVPKRNTKALAERLMEITKLSEANKLKVQVNAQQRVEELYNIDQQQLKFQKFYNLK